jgi:hypothetical protein
MQITNELVEKAARTLCDEWGYDWDGDPRTDPQGTPETCGDYDERPSKALYRSAARAVIEAINPAVGAEGGPVLEAADEIERLTKEWAEVHSAMLAALKHVAVLGHGKCTIGKPLAYMVSAAIAKAEGRS